MPQERIEAPRNLRGYKEDDQVYVLNVSHLPDEDGNPTQTWGDISLSIQTDEGLQAVVVPKSPNPFELTAHADVASLRKSTNVQRMIANGMLQIISADDAQAILRSKAGQEETRRLERWRNGREMVDGVYINSRLNTDRPGGNEAARPVDGGPQKTFTNLDVIRSLIEGVQSNRISDEAAMTALAGIATIYSVAEIDSLLETNLPRVLSNGLREIRQKRISG